MSATPTAPRLPLIGSLAHLRFSSSDFLLATSRRLGDAYWLSLGVEHVLVIGHPDTANQVLENFDGLYPDKGGATGFRRSSLPFVGSGLSTWNGMDAEWRHRRSAMARVLRPARPPRDWSLGAGTVGGRELRFSIERRVTLDLAHHFLGVDVDSREATEVVTCFHDLASGFWSGKTPRPRPNLAQRARRATTRLEEIVDSWVAGSSESAPIRHHLPDLGVERIRDEVLSQLLSVGTLAIPTEWALRLLANDQEVQAELRASVDRGENEQMQRVVHETLRLCPSTYWIQRRSSRDHEIAGVPVSAGDRVVIHIPSVHRHPGTWSAPDAFRPERFAGNAWKRAWIPFGRAARLCVAQRYSMDVMASVIANVVRRTRVTATNPDEMVLGTGLNLIPRSSSLTFTAR